MHNREADREESGRLCTGRRPLRGPLCPSRRVMHGLPTTRLPPIGRSSTVRDLTIIFHNHLLSIQLRLQPGRLIHSLDQATTAITRTVNNCQKSRTDDEHP